MTRIDRLEAVLAAVIAAALLLPALVLAQDHDTQEVLSNVLTDAGLAKYAKATRSIAALPGACEDENANEDEDSDSQSLDAIVTRLNATPGAKAAIQSAGMTTREYIVFSWSILQNGLAAWALDQPGGKLPAGASKANVDFVRRHEAELQNLSQLTESSDCNENAADEEIEDA